jgi:phenylalanyl-tRNA synthetase alpha subunit
MNPVVGLFQNFDALNIPETHVSRTKSDTYYVNEQQILRTHTSAHQLELLKQGLNHFVAFGMRIVMQVMCTEEMKLIGFTILSSIRWRPSACSDTGIG